MPKRKRLVRFEEPAKDNFSERQGSVLTHFQLDSETNADESGSLSLLNDPTNAIAVTAFDLKDELKDGVERDEEGIVPQHLATLADSDGASYENSSTDELERITPNRTHSDDDVDECDDEIAAQDVEDESNDDYDQSHNPDSLPMIADAIALGHEKNKTNSPPRKRMRSDVAGTLMTIGDAAGVLARDLHDGETSTDAMKRLEDGTDGHKHADRNRITRAHRTLQNHGIAVEDLDREGIVKSIPQWELCWGDVPSGETHGPMPVNAFLTWGHARYFMQQKIAWVRPFGTSKWWRASDVFRTKHPLKSD